MIFGSRLLSLFSVSAVYSFLKYRRYTTNRQANKFEELRLRFRFWSPRRDLFSDPQRNRNLCLGRDPYYGNHRLQRLSLSKRFKPVLICRCVSLHRILQGVKCATQTITAVPAAGMARKRSYHLQPGCWNEHRWFNFSGKFQTALLNWLCKARKEVVVSLPNFLCILISRSLSNLKLKYTTVFKHKRIQNCITHSKVSRNIMAGGRRCGQRSTTMGDYNITHSMQYARSRWCTACCTPLQQLRFWIHLMTVSMLNIALF